MVSLDFFIDIILLVTLALGSTKPLTEMSTYQEYFLGVKAVGV
jgi:hypothetical protein